MARQDITRMPAIQARIETSSCGCIPRVAKSSLRQPIDLFKSWSFWSSSRRTSTPFAANLARISGEAESRSPTIRSGSTSPRLQSQGSVSGGAGVRGEGRPRQTCGQVVRHDPQHHQHRYGCRLCDREEGVGSDGGRMKSASAITVGMVGEPRCHRRGNTFGRL